MKAPADTTKEPSATLADDVIDAIEEETGEHLSQELETRIRALESSTPDESLKALEAAVEQLDRFEQGMIDRQGRFIDRRDVLKLIADAKAAQGEPKEMRA